MKFILLTTLALVALAPAGDEVRFNRDIRPILSAKCVACHGPDAKHRAADLRLDTPEGAFAKLKESSGHAIVAGDPDASALIKRITSKDPEFVMPPPDFHKVVTAEELALLTKWIRQGAVYEAHWSYTPLVRPEVPKVGKHAGLVRNPIDAFILSRLAGEGLEPSAQAAHQDLRRRISLDLTGLPPAPGAPADLDKVIDAALASPAFGERLAVPWLDVVRFADTVGYHGDQNQRIFPYRDYVIHSFNSNKPFDVFVREQLAGDLLPDAGDEQHIASGFNRLALVTREGGAQSKEYFKKYAADRVRAVGSAFLGQTTGCAECHDHKYDPISARDFYSLAAFFDDVKQWGAHNNYTTGPKYNGNHEPFAPERIVRQDSLVARLHRLREQALGLLEPVPVHASLLDPAIDKLRDFAGHHPGGWAELTPLAVRAKAGTPHEILAGEAAVRLGGQVRQAEQVDIELSLPHSMLGSLRVEMLPDSQNDTRIGREDGGHFTTNPAFFLLDSEGNETPLEIRWSQADLDREYDFRSDIDHGYRLSHQINLKSGWQSAPKPEFEGPDSLTSRTQTATFSLKEPLDPGAGTRILARFPTASFAKVRVSVSPVLDPVPGEAAFTPRFLASLDSDPGGRQAAYHLCFTPAAKLPAAYQQMLEQIRACRSGWARTVVTVQVGQPEFPTRVLSRGDWQDDSGELVDPAVLSFLPSESIPKDRKLNRLDLAEWIVADENPLTARHFVNRLWKQFFGRGISNILDDLGGQGEPPTHPELLDWLAVEFRESGWDVKHIVRLMVDSHAYRQRAALRDDLSEIDPYNKLHAQQTGRRLDAEFIRDQALAAAGLLDESYVGGPSIRIYQPADYYQNLNFPARSYTAHLDYRQHRRSVYAHWQRTFPLPTLSNFDAPSRDECAAERMQANIPQQALTLLNDPVFVEASRGLALRVLQELPRGNDAERLERMFEVLLARAPDTSERERILAFHAKQVTRFKDGTDQTGPFLAIGIAPVPEAIDRIDLAAWSQTARLLLNLHETITRY